MEDNGLKPSWGWSALAKYMIKGEIHRVDNDQDEIVLGDVEVWKRMLLLSQACYRKALDLTSEINAKYYSRHYHWLTGSQQSDSRKHTQTRTKKQQFRMNRNRLMNISMLEVFWRGIERGILYFATLRIYGKRTPALDYALVYCSTVYLKLKTSWVKRQWLFYQTFRRFWKWTCMTKSNQNCIINLIISEVCDTRISTSLPTELIMTSTLVLYSSAIMVHQDYQSPVSNKIDHPALIIEA